MHLKDVIMVDGHGVFNLTLHGVFNLNELSSWLKGYWGKHIKYIKARKL